MTDETEDAAARMVSDLSPHPDIEQIWRERARAYGSDYNHQYKGNVHWQAALNTLAATGSLPLALREANISRAAFNKRRERYPEFAEAVLQANEYFRGKVIEQTAVARAVDGVLEPVFYKGTIVGYVRKFSDPLLVKLLEGNLPDKYRSKTENSPPGSITIIGGLPDDPPEEAASAPAAAPSAPTESDDPLA